jgi:hypothetical protein
MSRQPLQWDGYSRVSNAISELHLTGSPLKWLLDRGRDWSTTHWSSHSAIGARQTIQAFRRCALPQPAPSVEESNLAAKEDADEHLSATHGQCPH